MPGLVGRGPSGTGLDFIRDGWLLSEGFCPTCRIPLLEPGPDVVDWVLVAGLEPSAWGGDCGCCGCQWRVHTDGTLTWTTPRYECGCDPALGARGMAETS